MLACIFAYGLYSSDQAFLFTGFAALLILDLWSMARQPYFSRTISSALEKLERRVEELEQTQPPANPAAVEGAPESHLSNSSSSSISHT